MLQDIAEHLACPHCGDGLRLDGRTLRCAAGHSFDVARQGYASLLPGDAHTGTGDTPAMVAARDAFLAAGHYAPLADALAEAAADALAGAPAGGCVADLGAGTGHYLAAVLDRLPQDRPGAALDLSKHAVRRAARAHPRIGAVVCDAWRPLPLRDASAALVLNVFAPRNGPEIRRVLRPGGTLLVASPGAEHLRELVAPLGLISVDGDKDRRIAEKLGPHLTAGGRRGLRWTLSLSRAEAEALVAMGPSARHTDPERLAVLLAGMPDPVEVTASVTVAAYHRDPER
ncbi:putative RNA methyltransferase [Streptomyces sp. NPDC001380]|uniref:putative RNA methyltransferase n=1 Tax=Streptomyces sp. NPDC001380 TaxID=3364566 RepID=UPI0036A2094D